MNQEKIFSVLIVDDEAKNIQLLGNLLTEQGYEAEFALNGEEALEWAGTCQFDLILLDVMMPGIDGFDVCKDLKALPVTQDIPVIFLTAKTETEDIVRGFDAGAVDYVTKPFNSVELMARVKTHLELKYSRDILREMAYMDGLTRLYNHTCIHERLSQEISLARRHNRPLSIIMLDLDYFKRINDTFGHKTGDQVLVRTAFLIKSMLRKEDMAGRYGGEEFVIILPDTIGESACTVGEKIRTALENETWNIPGLSVSISAGVCAFEDEDADQLVEKADRLLYQAKNSGRNRIISR